MDDEDKRFVHFLKDPKFNKRSKKVQKVNIDKRFQSMFKNKNFQANYSIDKRGRPLNQTSTGDLKRFYAVSSEEEEEEEEERGEGEVEDINDSENNKNQLENKEKIDKCLAKNVKEKLKNLAINYARGEADLFSESSSDDEDSEEDEEYNENESNETSVGIDHKWGELDNDADSTENATHRLAACNMNWDRIRAVDLMILFNSFLPPGGVIKSVKIYPSEFGKQRMIHEETKGPTELVDGSGMSEFNDVSNRDTEEGGTFHMEKLRQYQLNRLKYYYAIIECDGVNTANKIYTECDGIEYESSATKIDLRFVPDDMEFDVEAVKEECLKLPEKYEPRFFTTTALQQAKVELTWDETDPERLEIQQKLENKGKLDEIDLKNYLASSSENDEEIEEDEKIESQDIYRKNEDQIEKYKKLLSDIHEKDSKKDKIEMEFTWGTELEKDIEQKKKKQDNDQKTPFEQYLEKRKEKRKDKKKQKLQAKNGEDAENSDDSIDMNDPYFAEEFDNLPKKKSRNKSKTKTEDVENEEDKQNLELLLMDDDKQSHFNYKNMQIDDKNIKKRKRGKNNKEEEKYDDSFVLDVNDDRFSALYTSHLYNIDPTDSHFKKTKGMETIINEKIKRRKNEENEKRAFSTTDSTIISSKKSELSVLVKSVKNKTANSFKNKNK